MKLFKSLLLQFALAVLFLNFIQAQEVFFADYPCLTPDGSTIIFSHKGDLWQVAATGGTATRITAMDGIESHPRISPDGKWLAFTGRQFGNPDVYLMPLKGGDVKQLTFHDGSDRMETWSWDSETIYFNSTRENRGTTFSVSIEGGTPKRLFQHYFNRDHNVAIHPSGELYFNESWESNNFLHRKGYKGAFNPDIKSYNPKNGSYKEHTSYEGKDMQPTIDRKGNVYFSSDEFNGQYNLYTLDKGKKKRLTKFESSIYHPLVSADGSQIVFRKDYQLWTYDVKRNRARQVPIQIAQNSTLEKTQDFKVQNNITFFDVSSDGKKLAFVSRGELFVSDIKGKFIRQLNTRADGRVLEVHWLKDDRSLIFNQTVGGYQNWFTVAADGSGKEKQITSDVANNRQLDFNSDKTKAVYLSGREEVRLLDLESMESKLLVKDELWGFYNDTPQWAPDDKHITFTAYDNFERDILLVNTETGEKKNLTQTGVTEAGPVWSPDGKYLYFISNRTQPSYPFGLQDAKVYRLALEKHDRPYRQDKFDELFKEEKKDEEKEEKKDDEKKEEKKEDKKDADKSKEEKKKPEVNIDYEDLMDRVERISPRFGTQSGVYVIQKDQKTTVLYPSNHDEGNTAIWKTVMEPFEKTKTEKISGTGGSLFIREAKGKHYLLSRGNIHTLNVDGKKATKIDMNFTFRRALRAEFEQMYEETWANLEENFYNETFHGTNWKEMRNSYANFLPHISSRDDLRRLLNDMLGELNTSHFGFSSFGKEENGFYRTRTMATGLVFDPQSPYRVKRIIKDGPADRKGKDIKPGDELIAVNGKKVDPGTNREYYFSHPSIDDEVMLTFRRGEEEKIVKIHPVASFVQSSLLYDEWQDQCQQHVDKKTNNRIAYVHMKNMGTGELNQFLEEMVSEWHAKDGLILDLRNNTGGNVHDKVLQFLAQRPYLKWKYREGGLSSQPNFSPAGKPIVLLINEQSLSDAEMTTAGFKQLELGKVIGTETYRWIIFTSGKGLVDGSFYRLPSWGCYTLDGKNLERTGVAPDISVKNTFKDRQEGKDPQLDRAIAEILKELK